MPKNDKMTKAIRKAAKEGRVEYADTFEIEPYQYAVDEFLENVLSIKSAFTSDLSQLNDFCWTDSDRVRAFELYGLTLTGEELLKDIGKKLHEEYFENE